VTAHLKAVGRTGGVAQARPLRTVVTGASSGLGRALCLEIARRSPGASMLLIARRRDELERLAADCRDARCTLAPIDLTDTPALREACARFVADGVPDLVVANAGISAGTLTEIVDDRASFRRIIDVNLIGLMETLGPFIEPMREAGRGRLVGIASVAGIRGLPGASAYSASKAAVISHLESLRVELRGSGVDVVTLAPGYVRTPMTDANPYRMPFLIDADVFARRALDAIESGRRFVVIPWQMGIVARLLRLMPDPLYDLLFARAPRKPR
jgi:short-subunit dehydrogenase